LKRSFNIQLGEVNEVMVKYKVGGQLNLLESFPMIGGRGGGEQTDDKSFVGGETVGNGTKPVCVVRPE
jgi:hypothetical protein